MGVLVLTKGELEQALRDADVVGAVEAAFRCLAEGRANLPGVISLLLPEKRGEYHIKGAHLAGSPWVIFKTAISYYDNPARGLSSSEGYFAAFDAETGKLRALLFDESWLTHLRTGAAGAVAAKYLARKRLDRVAVLGCGTQGRFQARLLPAVREVGRFVAWDIDPANAEAFKREVEETTGLGVSVAPDARAAVEGSDCVVTVTPSRRPFVKCEWIRPGMHVTAVGADEPGKQELDERIFGLADLIVVDRLAQCVERGELHHAVEKGIVTPADVAGELGDLVTGRIRGRTSDDQITVCDLTGVGVQDAAVAALALERAATLGLGREIA